MALKRSVIAGLHGSGALGLARRLRRGRFLGATVLLYHRVLPAGTPVDHYAARMGDPTAPQLEALVRYLKRWFRFSTPQACVERWRRGEEVEPYTLLLTFDDGYADLYEHLPPVLARCDVPATVFVTTGAIGGGYATWFQRLFAAVGRAVRPSLPPFDGLPDLPLETSAQRVEAIEAVSARQRHHPAGAWEGLIDRLCDRLDWDGRLDGQRMMDWGQVSALHRSGRVTVGGHTVTHPSLDACDATQVRRELFGSADELRSRLGQPGFVPFAYPHGRCPPAAVRDVVRDAGYGCAFTGRWAANTSRTPLYELGRQHVPPDSLARASLLLSGMKGRPRPAAPAGPT